MSTAITNVQLFNIVCTTQNTEYSQLIQRARKVRLQARAADIRLSYRAGFVASGAPFWTVKAGSIPLILDNLTGADLTLYVASGTGGAVLEAEAWV